MQMPQKCIEKALRMRNFPTTWTKKQMNTDKKALDLLVSSLHKGTEGRNGEWELLGSALQSSGVYSRSVRANYSKSMIIKQK